MQLGLGDCVDKNLLVQTWFRKVWALQLVPPADVSNVFEKFIKTTVPYEDDDDDLDDRVEGYDEVLAQFVTYLESNWIGTPRPHAPRKKPRFAITTDNQRDSAGGHRVLHQLI